VSLFLFFHLDRKFRGQDWLQHSIPEAARIYFLLFPRTLPKDTGVALACCLTAVSRSSTPPCSFRAASYTLILPVTHPLDVIIQKKLFFKKKSLLLCHPLFATLIASSSPLDR